MGPQKQSTVCIKQVLVKIVDYEALLRPSIIIAFPDPKMNVSGSQKKSLSYRPETAQ